MSRKITMPKCPYCGKEQEYKIWDYNTNKLVGMATGTGSSDVVLQCDNCGNKYRVSCSIRFYTKKM